MRPPGYESPAVGRNRGSIRFVTLVAAAFVLAGCGSAGSPKITVGTMNQLRHQRVMAIVNLGGVMSTPDWQAQGFGAVWVADDRAATVHRIDARTNRVTQIHTSIAQPCAGLATGFGSVWSADCSLGTIDRIDPRSMKVVARANVAPAESEGQIAVDGHGVWVVVSDILTLKTELERIDPSTNSVVEKIPVPATSAAVASGFGAEWVTSPDSGTVERVDPGAGKVVATIKVHPGPRFIAAGASGVWTLNQGDGTVSRIDPRSNKVAATITARVPGQGGCIATGPASVWVTMPGTPVIRIDPGSNRVTERFKGQGGDCISAGFGSVWLSNNRFGTVWRIRP